MAITDIYGNVIPTGEIVIEDYYEEEMEDTIAKVRAINDEPALVFPFVTDIHRFSVSTQTFDDMINNITYFTQRVKCDLVANTGDNTDGDVAKDTTTERANAMNEAFMNIGLPYIFAEGNHDNNIYGSSDAYIYTLQQTFQAWFTNVKGGTYNISEKGTDYYIDFNNIGIRLIVLNACNVSKANNYAYGDSTAAWLTNTALDTDHTVLLFVHLSPVASQVWNNNHGTNADAVKNALQAFVTGGGTIVQLSGHSHMDLAFIQPWLSFASVCQKFYVADPTSTNSMKISGFIDIKDAPARTAGTYTEDAWTACVLKPYSKELDCIRFGAGVDRYFHYNAIAPTTLTTRLSDVTWSSSDTSVATVSNGVVTGVASGTCAILAKDSEGNYEAWIVTVS